MKSAHSIGLAGPVLPSTCIKVSPGRTLRSPLLITRAAASPADTASTEWDPESLLPPKPEGGHFARKGLATPATSALLTPTESTSTTDNGLTVPFTKRKVGENHSAPEEGIGSRIETAFLETFSNTAPRVLDSFRRLRAGRTFKKHWEGKGLQVADSYIEGLAADPFPDVYGGKYDWLVEIEKNAAEIQQEFLEANKDGDEALAAKGNKIWVPAARKEAVEYGPAWRTLVLQDRGIWDEENARLFPKTRQLITRINAPSVEVFFARQEAGTGIKSHTDYANFIQTSHVGIDVPEGECWIKVGDHTREWMNCKAIAMDTSFMHETQNNGKKDRYVLIIRHYHPDLTELEKIGVQFLYDALDEPSGAGIKAAQKKASKAIKGIKSAVVAGKKKKSSGGGFGGGGFGKK